MSALLPPVAGLVPALCADGLAPHSLAAVARSACRSCSSFQILLHQSVNVTLQGWCQLFDVEVLQRMVGRVTATLANNHQFLNVPRCSGQLFLWSDR